jgi:hypothetical protein
MMQGIPRHLGALLGEARSGGYDLLIRVNSAESAPSPPPPAAAREQLSVTADRDVALSLLTAYLLDRVPHRPPKRLAARRDEALDRLRQDRLQTTLRGPSAPPAPA